MKTTQKQFTRPQRTRNKGNAAASNKTLQKPGKKVRNSKKSHCVDGSHEEKIKIPDNFSAEQEHQNQMNMIFNNPEYFQQFAHQLQQDQDYPYPTMYIIPLESDSQIIPEPSIESHQDSYDTDININTTVTTLSNSSYSVKSEIDVDYSSDYYSDSASSSLSSSSSSSPCMSSSSSCGGDLDDDEPMTCRRH